MIEIFGYVASAVIVFSLTMTSLVKLRLVGLVGALLFGTYGVLVEAWPVVATNVVIIGLHVYFLWKAWTDDEYFTLLEVRPDSLYLLEFLEFHRTDIERTQPGLAYEPAEDHFAMLVLRDMVPAGLFIARQRADTMAVELDYVTAAYRDHKAAEFLFDTNREVFQERGVATLRASAATEPHRLYLARIGFSEVSAGTYELEL